VAYEFKLTRQVEFCETDLAGIVHFSNFFRYMESAEHAFFRSLGLSIVAPGSDDRIGWPRVSVSCDYKRPLRFEDTFEIHLLVNEKRRSSLIYTIIFRKPAGESVQEVARGRLVVACVKWDPKTGEMRSTPIPPAIAGKIDNAPEELL
jgi:YbgC/YbaW family acyl-CoA thioester hydrolase